jgi:hypothetical protein
MLKGNLLTNNEQRTTNNEQRTTNNEQRTTNNKMPLPPIGLLHTDDVGNEYEAIRQTLEYFGYEVFRRAIGRPANFVNIINGEDELFAQLPIWILSVHGEDSCFLMPELAEDIYEQEEPRQPIDADFLLKNGRFNKQLILTTGCSLGTGRMAQAFIQNQATVYIATPEYVEGNASLLFIHHFFYQLLKKPQRFKEAFLKANAIDEETQAFRFFQ